MKLFSLSKDLFYILRCNAPEYILYHTFANFFHFKERFLKADYSAEQRENVTFGDFDFGVVFWFDSKLTTWKLSSKFPLWMKLYHHQQISEQLSVIIMQMEFKLLVRTWNPRLNVSNCFIAKFTDSRWHFVQNTTEVCSNSCCQVLYLFSSSSSGQWGWSAAVSHSDNNMITLHAPSHQNNLSDNPWYFPSCETDYKTVRIWPGVGLCYYVRSHRDTQKLRSALCSAINFNGWC